MTQALSIRGANKRFGGNHVVQNVTFSVQEGEIYGLIGPNGAGKTTLFNCITGFHRFDSGEVQFKDKRIERWLPDRICRYGMARTWQRVKPLSGLSVLENVMVGAFTRLASPVAAKKAALTELSKVGLDAWTNEKAGALPIGLKKKLELARVLATKPTLLLLDEICGGLNTAETSAILDIVRHIRKSGCTIIFIEHDMKAVTSLCDRILVLDSGSWLAEGSPSEITTNQKVIDAYLGTSHDTLS